MEYPSGHPKAYDSGEVALPSVVAVGNGAELVPVAAEDTALPRADVADSAPEDGLTAVEEEALEPVAAAEPVTLSAALEAEPVTLLTALEAAEDALLATDETTEEACRLLSGEATTADAPSARSAVFLMNMVVCVGLRGRVENMYAIQLSGRLG